MPFNKVRPSGVWHRLSNAAFDQSEGHRSRLLAGVLLILIPITLALVINGILLSEPASIYHPDFWLGPLAILLLGAAYAINRSGSYRPAVILTLMVVSATIFAAAIPHFPNDPVSNIDTLIFLPAVILLSSMFLSWRGTLLITAVNLFGFVLVLGLLPAVSRFEMVRYIFHFLLFASLIILAMQQRDRLEAERQSVIAASEARYRSLFDSVPVGLYRSQPDGRFLDVNLVLVTILGYPNRDTLLGTPADKLYVFPEERRSWIEEAKRAGGVHNMKLQLYRYDGSVIWTQFSGQVVGEEGPDLYLEGAIQDITDLKQAEEEQDKLRTQLLRSQKMEAIGRLTAGIVHDFNNLLTAIGGFADLVRSGLNSDHPQQADVDRILSSSRRASDLVRRLLIFSRQEAIEPQVLSLNAVVGETEKILRRLIGEDINLATILAPDLWPVKVDPGQIEQVIVNLVVNARDAMPEGGRLTIETANIVLDTMYAANHLEVEPGDYVLLAITDTGTGMSEAAKAHLFEPFFTTKPPGRGTGLGLATVFGSIKQHNGQVWVYSEEGRGTTVKIYLPRSREVGTAPTTNEIKLDVPVGTETILLVEDDAGVRELTRRVLSNLGYTVVVADNYQEAMEVVVRQPVHLLLTDVVMPQMNGRELAQQLVQSWPELKVLFMSGYTSNVVVEYGVLDRNAAFLAKPFTPLALARKVRLVLDK